MPEKTPPTYEELRAKRADEWQTAQRRAAAELSDRHAALAKMPDVRNAPDVGALYGEHGMVCPCGSEGFKVRRYVTVNGKKHRGEFECCGCGRVDTWDWHLKAWLQPIIEAERSTKPSA